VSVGRLPPAAPQLPAVRPGATTPASKDAQRAFFAAALARTAPAQSTTPTVTEAPAAPARPIRAPEPEPEPTGRYLRPGSLLDIKV
jgi:hypothetical protein